MLLAQGFKGHVPLWSYALWSYALWSCTLLVLHLVGHVPCWSFFLLVMIHVGNAPCWSCSLLVMLPVGHAPCWSCSLLVMLPVGHAPCWSCSLLVMHPIGQCHDALTKLYNSHWFKKQNIYSYCKKIKLICYVICFGCIMFIKFYIFLQIYFVHWISKCIHGNKLLMNLIVLQKLHVNRLHSVNSTTF